MKYLVMECGTAYAIVLDDRGQFLRVANMGYEVGQTVTDVIPAGASHPGKRYMIRRMARLALSAVFTFLMIFGLYHYVFAAFGTVRIQINPDVLLSVNRLGYVLDVSGLNEDGRILAEGYGTFGKKLTDAACELTERAVSMGFLADGSTIGIAADSDDGGWRTETVTRLMIELQVYLTGRGMKDIGVLPAEDKPVDIPETKESTPASVLTAEEAAAAAARYFGLPEGTAAAKIEDKNDVYEIEFAADGMEYDCEVRKSDGAVLHAEIDRDD